MTVFTIWGEPRPKGSKSAFAIRKAGQLTGRVAVVEGKTSRQRDWARRVEEVVQAQAASGAPLLDGPLALTVTFYLPRPVSAPKHRVWPDRKPDLDKLVRSLDPMTGVLIADDARIVRLVATKVYVTPDDLRPRAEVEVTELNPRAREEVAEGGTEDPGSTGRAGDLPAVASV